MSARYDYRGTPFRKNSLYFRTLPGDEIEYDPHDMTIKRVTGRQENTTIAKIEDGTMTLPLLSTTFREHAFEDAGYYIAELPEMNLTRLNTLYEAVSNTYLKTGSGHKYSPASRSDPHFTKEFQNLGHLETFTVDPHDSTDFDDAISVEYSEGGDISKIYTHIVDINHYMAAGSREDFRAYALGMTLYNPEGVIHATSRVDEYSLVTGVPRRVITTEFKIECNKISSYDIYESEITVKNRYTYETFPPHPSLRGFVKANVREDIISIPFLKMRVETGIVRDYHLEWSSDDNHRIVETLMVLTNAAVANHLKSRGVNYPSRYHSMSKSATETVDIENPLVKSYIELKNYSRACYSVDFSGHAGLNLDCYTHFTSPLRRYPDVMIHRLLGGYVYSKMDKMTNHLNQREKLIDKLYNYYSDEMKRTIGAGGRQRYIIKVTSAGICVLDPEIMLEEYIHVSNLKPHCRYIFEDGCLSGGGVTYCLGDVYNYH